MSVSPFYYLSQTLETSMSFYASCDDGVNIFLRCKIKKIIKKDHKNLINCHFMLRKLSFTKHNGKILIS